MNGARTTLAWGRPAFKVGLDRLFRISEQLGQLRAQKGAWAATKRAALSAAAGATFLRLLAMPRER